MRELSDHYRAEVMAEEMGDVQITLITILHDSLPEPIRVSSDPTHELSSGFKGTLSNGVEYTQLPFELTMQEQTNNMIARAVLKIDNVSREILAAVRRATGSPPIVNIQFVLSSDPDYVEFQIPNLRLDNIKADARVVQGDLMPRIFQGEKFPKNTITLANFPGVFG